MINGQTLALCAQGIPPKKKDSKKRRACVAFFSASRYAGRKAPNNTTQNEAVCRQRVHPLRCEPRILRHVQIVVFPLLREQPVVAAAFYDLPVIHDHDEVGVADRGKAMRNDDAGSVFHPKSGSSGR